MSQKIIRKGNLEYREAGNGGTGTAFHVVLTHCPVCGFEFTHGASRIAHLGDHGPTDFGLSELNEQEK